jgi:outer membrane protein OmpA-like peptidoglycan-associated protein
MDAGLNKPRVGIEIIGKEYVSFLDLDEPSTETLDLTTVVNNQSKAFVKVFLFKGDSKTLITEFKVMNLPPCEAGYPDIVINGKFDGRKTLTLGIVLNGRTYNSESLSLRKYLPRKARAPVIASFGCALAIGCFLIMYKGYHTGVKKSQKEISRQTGPVESVSRPVIDRTAETTVPRKPPPEHSVSVAEVKSAAPGDTGLVREKPMPGSASGNAVCTVYFAPGSARLDRNARAVLDGLMPQLARIQGKITITGRCALYGTEEGRIQLSELRARRVADYLRASGWMPAEKPLVEGIGGREPVTRDAASQHLNRMVAIAPQ